jgi:DNA-binding response OmpR family regulator
MSRLLLIEPDRLLAKHYAGVLRAAGHEVICCLTGQSAIQAADEHTPDVVILELQLKGHNGVEFLYEFRSYPEWQSIPVIVQTLVPPQVLENIAAVPLLGIAAYLYKPTSNLEKLTDAVADLLQPVSV